DLRGRGDWFGGVANWGDVLSASFIRNDCSFCGCDGTSHVFVWGLAYGKFCGGGGGAGGKGIIFSRGPPARRGGVFFSFFPLGFFWGGWGPPVWPRQPRPLPLYASSPWRWQ